jgi:MFS transporter, MCT family, solute carrier family 16 (monocarboxylic acid transporters), member 10
LPLLLPIMLKRWGMAMTLRVISIIIAVILVLALPFLRGRLPYARVRANPTRTTDRRWIRAPLFWIFIITNLFQGLAFFVPVLWLPCKRVISFNHGAAS